MLKTGKCGYKIDRKWQSKLHALGIKHWWLISVWYKRESLITILLSSNVGVKGQCKAYIHNCHSKGKLPHIL